ncbi:hypothetical protein ACTGXM_11400, partial [Streptococcus suis]
ADVIVMSDEAKKRKIGDEADLRRRMQYARNKALRDDLLSVTARDAVTEAAVRKAFDEAIRLNSAEQQLRIRSMMFKFAEGADEGAVSAAEARANAA